MRLVDSHAHFDDYSFDEDRTQAYARARAVGVLAQVVPAVMARDWHRVEATCNEYPGLHPAYGLHPIYSEQHRRGHLDDLERWLGEKRAVAIGECGLDWYIENPDQPWQRELFEVQLDLARRYDLPVIVHARRSVEEVIMTLRRRPGLRGVLHSFAGSEEQAKRLMEIGFLMSFGGPVTYPRATRLRRLVATLPLESIMLETDAPDQPDVEHRGVRYEPANLPRVLAEIAALRGEEAGQIAEVTTGNAERLFGLRVV